LRLREILEAARSGERVAITFRGKPAALLLPIGEEPDLPEPRPYDEAWPEIEQALAATSPPHASPEDALRASRRRA
jgi:antitoxin (DNA-binding transcriptional repressor) of toxin-antitoxin stability system